LAADFSLLALDAELESVFIRFEGGNRGATFSDSNSDMLRLLGRVDGGVGGGDDASADGGEDGVANDVVRRFREPYVRCTLEVLMMDGGKGYWIRSASPTMMFWSEDRDCIESFLINATCLFGTIDATCFTVPVACQLHFEVSLMIKLKLQASSFKPHQASYTYYYYNSPSNFEHYRWKLKFGGLWSAIMIKIKSMCKMLQMRVRTFEDVRF
jgi:hypothetical protein